MVNHNQVGIHRLFACLDDKTFIMVRAFATQAIIGTGGCVRPEAIIFWNSAKFANITTLALIRPLGQR